MQGYCTRSLSFLTQIKRVLHDATFAHGSFWLSQATPIENDHMLIPFDPIATTRRSYMTMLRPFSH